METIMASKRKVIKTAARMTINAPGAMTAKGRRDIATWMRRQADHMLKQGKQYTTGRFTAAFNYVR
jgi:hypothetical protein